MKKICLFVLACALFAGCMGTRGTIGGQKVCTNDYLFGVLSLTELVDPCGR